MNYNVYESIPRTTPTHSVFTRFDLSYGKIHSCDFQLDEYIDNTCNRRAYTYIDIYLFAI